MYQLLLSIKLKFHIYKLHHHLNKIELDHNLQLSELVAQTDADPHLQTPEAPILAVNVLFVTIV